MFKNEFNGNRLREGRIYRGKTITDLAKELDVSKQMISKYENNQSTPGFEAISKLSNILNFPPGYFYEKPLEVLSGSTFFRSFLTTGKKEREMQESRVTYLAVIRNMLEEYIEFPEPIIPEFSTGSLGNPEELARKLRRIWDLGDEPIRDMVYLLESKGFVLTSLDVKHRKIDAFSSKKVIKGTSYYTIILTTDNTSFYRNQFSAAHELGHVFLHEPLSLKLDELDREEFKEIEREANDFAASFLLPRESFLEDILLHPTDLKYYEFLKRKWFVSIGMMVARAYKLGAISSETYQHLQRQISRKGWRTTEPLDKVKLIAKPQAMKQAVELLIENDYITTNEFMSKLSHDYNLTLHSEEVEKILGLHSGYLKGKNDYGEITPLVSLKESRSPNNIDP